MSCEQLRSAVELRYIRSIDKSGNVSAQNSVCLSVVGPLRSFFQIFVRSGSPPNDIARKGRCLLLLVVGIGCRFLATKFSKFKSVVGHGQQSVACSLQHHLPSPSTRAGDTTSCAQLCMLRICCQCQFRLTFHGSEKAELSGHLARSHPWRRKVKLEPSRC